MIMDTFMIRFKISNFWNDNKGYIIATILTVVGFFYVGNHLSIVETKIHCTVVSHATSSTSTGTIRYHTVLSCEDGYLRSDDDLNYYVLPVGTKATYTIREFKWQ